jgi:hypothetical protein
VKLQNYEYKCQCCGHQFKAPSLIGTPYGEFLLRSLHGDIAYLLAIDSQHFEAIKQMVKNDPRLISISSLGRAKVLHEIFGLTCDFAPDGSRYKIGRSPACPNCDSLESLNIGAVDPAEIIEMSIPAVTNLNWDTFDEESRKAVIDSGIDYVLSHKDELEII